MSPEIVKRWRAMPMRLITIRCVRLFNSAYKIYLFNRMRTCRYHSNERQQNITNGRLRIISVFNRT